YNGLLVVGDAASQIKSTTGGGIIFGLLCSRIAGEVANESLQKNDLGESFMSQYQDRWTKLIGFDLLAMRKLRKMLNRIPDEKMDNIVSLCSRFGLKKILGKINDLDFEGRSLIRMFRYPPVLAVAAYFIFSYLIGKPLVRAHEEQVW
ncbi:MAG: NAD(P)/FAD-dependent oxidoreductase, partial [Candidatus Ranarchaeia archaeon]